MELHPALEGIAGLVGTWQGAGEGHFPTIEPFTWRETMTVAAPPGRPVLAFRQRTLRPDGTPFHAEDGWVRALPDGPTGALELTVAQPTGIVEAHAGGHTTDGAAMVCDWTTTAVVGTPGARTVHGVRRRWRLTGDELVLDLWLWTPAVDGLTHHLSARLERTG